MGKIYNAIMGFVVGDALGVPYEFRKRGTFRATDMVGGGLAGIYYGVGGDKGIPTEWIDKIARRDWIAGLCDRFEKAIKERTVPA